MTQGDDPGKAQITEFEMLRELSAVDLANDTTRGHELLYYQAYYELCELVTGNKPSKTPPSEDEFAARVLDYLNRNREKAYEAICVKFAYCEKMKKYGYFSIPIPVLLGLTGILADALLSFGFASTCWMTLRGILDKFCDC